MSFIDKWIKYITDPKNKTNVIVGGIIAFFAFILLPWSIFAVILFLLIYFIANNSKRLLKNNKLILSINLLILTVSLSFLAGRGIDFEFFCLVFVLHLIANLILCLGFLVKDKELAKQFLLSFALVLLIGFSSCTAIMFSIN